MADNIWIDNRVGTVRSNKAHFPSGDPFAPALCGAKPPRVGWKIVSDEAIDELRLDRCERCNVKYVGGQR